MTNPATVAASSSRSVGGCFPKSPVSRDLVQIFSVVWRPCITTRDRSYGTAGPGLPGHRTSAPPANQNPRKLEAKRNSWNNPAGSKSFEWY